MSDSRSALLAAAAGEFARHGLHGTRVQAIVRAAGVNERMIYHHFGSKGGLYKAVLDDQMYALAAGWAPVLDEAVGKEPYEGMRMALTTFYDALSARPATVALLLHEALGGWRHRALPTADMLPTQVREIYERGQREGVFRPDCPFELAYGTAVGALFAQVVFDGGVGRPTESQRDRAVLRDQVVGLLLDGMTGRPHA